MFTAHYPPFWKKERCSSLFKHATGLGAEGVGLHGVAPSSPHLSLSLSLPLTMFPLPPDFHDGEETRSDDDGTRDGALDSNASDNDDDAPTPTKSLNQPCLPSSWPLTPASAHCAISSMNAVSIVNQTRLQQEVLRTQREAEARQQGGVRPAPHRS
ncbi:hypothetical protein QOT17_024840 [Balamuthia mandrillaris]